MHGLDCVGGVNYPPNVSWIFELNHYRLMPVGFRLE